MKNWLMTLLLFVISTGVNVQAQPWPMYQAGSSHTGYVPLTLPPKLFTLKWSKSIGTGKPLNPVTVADGKLFASLVVYFDDIDSFFTLDAATGDILWSKNFGSIFSVNPPSYAYGNVYVQTGNHSSDTYLRAYNADTGSLVFKSAHPAQWERYYAPTIFDGKVYVNGGSYGGMYAFDAFTGAQLWFTDLPQYDEWTPAVDDNYVYAYVGDYSPALYVADRMTGAIAFKIDDQNFDWNGWSMDSAPVLTDNQHVFAIHNGRLINFDLVNHNIDWEISQNFSGQPAYAKGVVYAIQAGALSARNATSGETLWAWEAPAESLTGAMIVTDSHIIVSSDETTYAVDMKTHADVWSYPATGHLTLNDHALYIAANDGTLTCLDYGNPTPTTSKGMLPAILKLLLDQ